MDAPIEHNRTEQLKSIDIRGRVPRPQVLSLGQLFDNLEMGRVERDTKSELSKLWQHCLVSGECIDHVADGLRRQRCLAFGQPIEDRLQEGALAGSLMGKNFD